MSRKRVYKITGWYGGQRIPLTADLETTNLEIFRKHCRHVAVYCPDHCSLTFWTPESEQVFEEVLDE